MSAPAQYDPIAAGYRSTRDSPLRNHVEAWTLDSLIGSVEDLRVLDLGCGEGHYARRLAAAGARRVVGVDEAPAMIALAREAGGERIEYVLSPVQAMPDLGRFDLVLGAYLLHYAGSIDDLALMCRRIAGHLVPGGRFVGLVENPDQPVEAYRGYDRYGFNKVLDGERHEGARITYRMIAGRELLRFDVYYYSRVSYERALVAAGLQAPRWHSLRLGPGALAARPAEYWQEYLDNPPVIALESGR